MRCQRCGFEMEPGQTFCSMCGTEQGDELHKKSKALKFKSLFGVISVSSNNHFYMWINFLLVTGIFIYILLGMKDSLGQVAYACCAILLMMFILFECLIPYKNPNASKSKKYKLYVKMVLALVVILALLVFFDNFSLMNLVKKI